MGTGQYKGQYLTGSPAGNPWVVCNGSLARISTTSKPGGYGHTRGRGRRNTLPKWGIQGMRHTVPRPPGGFLTLTM